MINSLLSFGAKSVNPLLLEETLTTRKIVVDEIEQKCVAKILKHTTYQSLVIAPRGSGKTHMTKVLHHRLIHNEVIRDKCVIAYMSEDEVGIDSLTDLIVSMFRAFIRYEEPGNEVLNKKIEEAADISTINERIAFIKTTLNEFANGRIIILLIENFDQIMAALKKNGQEELRDFIHEYNNLSIIATSQNLIQAIQKSDFPFYNFFNIFNLKRLTYDESVSFFQKIAAAEKQSELIEEMETPSFRGKLKAIYELTEGNHRLLVTFYSFLKAEYKSEFSNVFVKVMNDLKPYYEQFINALSTQQQKIVKFLSQHRRAISGKEIARACFIEPNTLSKQTSLLYEMRMIDKTKSGKDVYYELKEPLMRISFEIGDNPNGMASLFASFLSTYYEPAELGERFLEFKFGAEFQSENYKSLYLDEANLYFMALPPEIKVRIIEEFEQLKSAKDQNELQLKIKEIKAKIFGEQIFGKKEISLLVMAFSLIDGENSKIADSFFKFLKEYPDEPFGYLLIALNYFDQKKYPETLNFLRKGFEISPNDTSINISLVHVYFKINDLNQVVKHADILLKSKKNKPWTPQIKNLRTIALMYVSDRNRAKSNFSQLLKENDDRNNKKLIQESLNILFAEAIQSETASEFFKFLFKELKEQNQLELFWPKFSAEVFSFLQNMENFSVQDVTRFKTILEEELSLFPESIIPLKMLNIGINYLKKEDKNAIFELSKEERKMFKNLVLNENTNESKNFSIQDLLSNNDD